MSYRAPVRPPIADTIDVDATPLVGIHADLGKNRPFGHGPSLRGRAKKLLAKSIANVYDLNSA
jgi:hypothetical protein